MQVETDGGLENMLQNMTISTTMSSTMNESKSDLSQLNSIKENQDLSECMEQSYVSSKLGKAVKLAEELLDENPDDKLIIVSQWTSVLNLLAVRLKRKSIEYFEIKGDIPLFRRNELVQKFNSQDTDTRVMLLSLCAGGVGLNLIGANRM
jgi:transcription termination factor 2